MLLGFKKRFIDPIKIGTKVHTLRRNPKRKPKIGETLHMYSGLRTKYTEHISSSEKLISYQKAWIKVVWQTKPDGSYRLLKLKVCIDGKAIGEYDSIDVLPFEGAGYNLHRFVQFDGFIDFIDFVDFWIDPYKKQTRKPGVYKLVQSMNLYHWTDLRY